MNHEHNHLASLNELRLSTQEKARMRNILQAYITANVPRHAPTAFFLRHSTATALVAVLLLAGATTVLAHRSLPGDLFYPVKLAVNDRIAVATAGDDDAKLDTELAQIDRILQEEELVMLTMLDEEMDGNEEDYEEDKGKIWEDGDKKESDDDQQSDSSASGADEDWLVDIYAELRALENDLKSAERDTVPEED